MCDKKEDKSNESSGSGSSILGIVGGIVAGAAIGAGLYYGLKEDAPQRSEYAFPTDRDYRTNGYSLINDCPICNTKMEHNVSVLPCRHTFHKKCLDQRLQAQNNKACPICRKSF